MPEERTFEGGVIDFTRPPPACGYAGSTGEPALDEDAREATGEPAPGRHAREATGEPASDFDIVHPELLRPPDCAIDSGSRTDAAIVLDRELVALAGMDARCRIVQAKLCRRLMDLRAWIPAGFVRLSDYARERLGYSHRTLEDDARVMRALDQLPRLRAALEKQTVSWTQTRLLVRVATPSNETQLLEQAAVLSTRELEEFLRTSHPEPRPRAGAASDLDDDEEDDPAIRWEIEVSHTGRRLWRAACELASRTAGTPLTQAQALELVAAEASGARKPPGEREWSPPIDHLERRFLHGRVRDEHRGRRYLQAFLAETGAIEGFAWLDPARREPGPATQLDALAAGLADIDALEADRRLRNLRRICQRIDFQLGALLRIGSDRRLFREIGFATNKLYVELRLGISSRRVSSLIAITRESWRSCREPREAWRDGRISHLAAYLLLPVMSEQHGAAWIQRAQEVTLRRLSDEIAWALDFGDRTLCSSRPAPPPPDHDVRADGTGSVTDHEVQMRAHGQGPRDAWPAPGRLRLTFRVPVSVAALVELLLYEHRVGVEARWRTFERLVSLAIEEWTSVPRHRDPVFERDGWRCTVPGCSSRRNLHDHHVVFRSHGGGNGRNNRITACAAHHLHGIHAGVVRAQGAAPGGIVWEMGCRQGRQPLMRLHGDRYVSASSWR